MKVTFYGTRGSVPVCGPEFNGCGGNTTCLRVESDRLPEGQALVIDAGSGIVPLGTQLLREGIDAVSLLFTHYHHDHSQGLFLCPAIYPKKPRFDVYGPVEEKFGPKEMFEHIMRTPFHPVNFTEVANKFHFFPIAVPSSVVLVFHPKGGVKKVGIHELDGVEDRVPSQITIGKGRYDISECLVVRMLYTNHPERTVSYRIEDRTTGKVFVFLTDHENLDQMPVRMKAHLRQPDFLVMDCQYDRETYNNRTAGFGHATPDYCVRTASEVGAIALGLTHHDPLATDEKVIQIYDSAVTHASTIGYTGKILVCRDYLSLDV